MPVVDQLARVVPIQLGDDECRAADGVDPEVVA